MHRINRRALFHHVNRLPASRSGTPWRTEPFAIMEIRCEASSGNEEDVAGEVSVAAARPQLEHLAKVTGGRGVYAARRPGETIVP